MPKWLYDKEFLELERNFVSAALLDCESMIML